VDSSYRYTLHMPNDAGRIYFDLPGVAVVKWDAASQAAHMEWQGWAAPAEFRAANDALVQAITDHHSSKVLGDSRQVKVMQQSDQDWVNRDWFPRILAAGLTRMALVLPESGLAKMNIDDMVSRVADRLDMAYFETLDDARKWLARPAMDNVLTTPIG
jgi:SpoIIAA-like